MSPDYDPSCDDIGEAIVDSLKSRPAPQTDQMILFAMNEKGLAVLRAMLSAGLTSAVAGVVVKQDPAVERDYFEEIVSAARAAGISTIGRSEPIPPHAFSVAVGWRYMIPDEPRLIVFHDSLLPRYRGFAPLVNALINGETEIGVSVLWGEQRYDSGAIIAQASAPVDYPLTIQQAIDTVTPLYERLAVEIAERLIAGEQLPGREQDDRQATYSIWRDEEDYRIDWNQDAASVARFIDAVGPPYQGAYSYVGQQKLRIHGAEVVKDELTFELRHPGKVFSIADGTPVVICGDGLVRLISVADAETGKSALPWTRLRTRFRDA
jgi:methionyl-tRNA formyltransferase